MSIVTTAAIPAASPHRPALGALSALETVLSTAAVHGLPEVWAWRIGPVVGSDDLVISGQLLGDSVADIEAWAKALGGHVEGDRLRDGSIRIAACARIDGRDIEIWTTTESEA